VPIPRVPELSPLDRGYHDLLDGLLARSETDQRIRAVWLGGSVARGVADAGSDLDVIITVQADARLDFNAGWRTWLESFAEPLLAQPLPGMPGSFAATTTGCLRLDVVVESVDELDATSYRTRICVLDRDGLQDRLPTPVPTTGPDLDRIHELVGEFYRQQAIFPAAVVRREDWLLGVVAVHTMQVLLYELLVACNQPFPPMGLKQWSAKLTPKQQRLLTKLEQPDPTPDSVVSAMLDVRQAVRTAGRATATGAGVTWPDHVDAAIALCWQRSGLTPSA
jgi:Nucleotidyltransferase domain